MEQARWFAPRAAHLTDSAGCPNPTPAKQTLLRVNLSLANSPHYHPATGWYGEWRAVPRALCTPSAKTLNTQVPVAYPESLAGQWSRRRAENWSRTLDSPRIHIVPAHRYPRPQLPGQVEHRSFAYGGLVPATRGRECGEQAVPPAGHLLHTVAHSRNRIPPRERFQLTRGLDGKLG